MSQLHTTSLFLSSSLNRKVERTCIFFLLFVCVLLEESISCEQTHEHQQSSLPSSNGELVLKDRSQTDHNHIFSATCSKDSLIQKATLLAAKKVVGPL